MACQNCTDFSPGRIVRVKSLIPPLICAVCGTTITIKERTNKMAWDPYFHKICEAVASKSPCLSRKIGAILVRDRSIVSTGYNGPPRRIPHCGRDRFIKDKSLKINPPSWPAKEYDTTCPRRLLGYESGKGMEWCPAQHAEENAVSNAARLGTSTIGTILYMNSVIPCSKCFGTLINAGIIEIVVDEDIYFDNHTHYLMDNSNILIRRFIL